jgi:hypothetical protein
MNRYQITLENFAGKVNQCLTGSFPKNVMSDTGYRGRLLHNEQFAPFYGSVAFENAPHLHAGLCGAKSGRRGGSGARCFTASACGLAGVSSEWLAGGLCHFRSWGWGRGRQNHSYT